MQFNEKMGKYRKSKLKNIVKYKFQKENNAISVA
jgi:hypothetical protein